MRVQRHLDGPVEPVAVRLRFAERAGQLTLSVFDPDLIVTGVKVG
jgi:hypothetical protein